MELYEFTTKHEAAPGRLALRIPYEIRENFKDTFETWRWHNEAKLWSVDESERGKLMQWVGIVRAVASLSAENTERFMTAQEVERAEAATREAVAMLEALKAEQQTLAALRVTLAESEMVLQQRQEEIRAMEAALAFDRQERARHQADIDATLSALIDLPELRKAVETMTFFESSTNRREQAEWRAAHKKVYDMRNVLLETGIRLEALDFLADGGELIRKMAPGAWYNLTRSRA